jgi:hypothetical protein
MLLVSHFHRPLVNIVFVLPDAMSTSFLAAEARSGQNQIGESVTKRLTKVSKTKVTKAASGWLFYGPPRAGFFISGESMPEDQMPEISGEVLQRLNLKQEDVAELSKYFSAALRQNMRNDFYRDVGKGAFGLIKKAWLVLLLYLAWRGAGGATGWFEPVRKFLMG